MSRLPIYSVSKENNLRPDKKISHIPDPTRSISMPNAVFKATLVLPKSVKAEHYKIGSRHKFCDVI